MSDREIRIGLYYGRKKINEQHMRENGEILASGDGEGDGV